MVDALIQANSDEHAIQMWLFSKGAKTRQAYLTDLAQFRAAFPEPLGRITLSALQHYVVHLEGLSLKPASITRKMAAVKSLLTFCCKLGYLAFNPGAALPAAKRKRSLSGRLLSRVEVEQFLSGARCERDRILIQFAYETGARISEIVGLRWDDLTDRSPLGQATLLGKGDKSRDVVFSALLWQQLHGLRRDEGSFVFRTASGRPLSAHQAWMMFRRTARRVGLTKPVSPHWLRHACASHALDAGAPIHLVQQQLGHASLTTTTLYVHARPGVGLHQWLTSTPKEEPTP